MHFIETLNDVLADNYTRGNIFNIVNNTSAIAKRNFYPFSLT